MKKKYITPKVQIYSVEENTPLLAVSSVSVGSNEGNFDSDGNGGYVVNSRPGFTLWNEE